VTASGSCRGNRFRRMCHDDWLHYLRVREWRDLYSQLRQVAGQLDIRPGVDAAHPDHVHRAVLAGLLTHVGVRDDDGREFRGARDARFVIAPGSVLTKRPPRWVMAAELVETDRLRARRVATIQPEWAEPLARHLVKRSYGEPWWDPHQGRALIGETVTLYGLPIVANRTIGLDRVDRRLAREMFVHRALVAGEWESHHAFVETNERFRERVALLEARVRRADLIDDESVRDFFDARVPQRITSARAFERWWRDERREQPTLLDFDRSVLGDRSGIRLSDYPDTWTDGDAAYPITYRFDPSSALDGASVTVTLSELNQLDDTGFDWLVPGYRAELVDLLVRSLPKERRRDLIPMTETAAAAAERLDERHGSLRIALAAALNEVAGTDVKPHEFSTDRLPAHLRLHVIVIDDDGEVVDAGDDVEHVVLPGVEPRDTDDGGPDDRDRSPPTREERGDQDRERDGGGRVPRREAEPLEGGAAHVDVGADRLERSTPVDDLLDDGLLDDQLERQQHQERQGVLPASSDDRDHDAPDHGRSEHAHQLERPHHGFEPIRPPVDEPESIGLPVRHLPAPGDRGRHQEDTERDGDQGHGDPTRHRCPYGERLITGRPRGDAHRPVARITVPHHAPSDGPPAPFNVLTATGCGKGWRSHPAPTRSRGVRFGRDGRNLTRSTGAGGDGRSAARRSTRTRSARFAGRSP